MSGIRCQESGVRSGVILFVDATFLLGMELNLSKVRNDPFRYGIVLFGK